MATTLSTVGNLLERFDITPPRGPVLVGRMFQTQRPSGRRITVTTQSGELLFDSDDCYDAANASNSLKNWLAEYESAWREEVTA